MKESYNYKNLRNNLPKLLAEFLIIFLSVLLAFFFEDFREDRQEKKEYLEDLEFFFRDVADTYEVLLWDNDSVLFNIGETRGEEYERLIDLLWLDSLIDQRKARKLDFAYVMDKYFFETFPERSVSPIAEEIRTKYGEFASKRIKTITVQQYQRGIEVLKKFDQGRDQLLNDINKIVINTDPNNRFTDKDSIVLYSNKFARVFKRIVENQQWIWGYSSLLINDKFYQVLSDLNSELAKYELDKPLPDLSDLQEVKYRFQHSEGRPYNATNDKIIMIEDLVIEKRLEFEKGNTSHNRRFK